MPDAALKQYATMHKNDPYTMSLAMSESNRRKQMREGAQAKVGQQPTVIDQELLQMGAPQQAPMPQGQAQAMPESVGIGALPANNMQNMAEGGIVAFDVGGGVGTTQADEAKRRELEFEQFKKDSAIRASADPLGLAGALSGAYTGVKNWLTAPPPTATLRDDTSNPDIKQMAVPATDAAPAVVADTTTGATTGAIPAPATGTTPANAAAAAAAYRGLGTPNLGGLGSGGGRSAAPALSYLEQLKATQKTQGPTVDPEKVAKEALVAKRTEGATAGQTELEADIASRADQFKKREARQDVRATALEKSRDTNTGMAFLQAGLAMMQAKGPGLAAIAQGAGVGVGQYAAGLKDLKMAQEKLDEARDKTDELKQNQSMMDKRELRAAKKDVRDTELQGQEYLIAGRARTHGEELETARAATKSDIEATQKRDELRSKERIAALANAASLRPGETERITATYLQLKAKDPAAAETYIQGIERAKGAGKSVEAKIADTAYDNVLKQAEKPMFMKNYNTPEKFNAAVEAETKRLRGASGTMAQPGAETAPPGTEIQYDATGKRVK